MIDMRLKIEDNLRRVMKPTALPSARGVKIATAGRANMKLGRVREAMWEVMIFVFAAYQTMDGQKSRPRVELR